MTIYSGRETFRPDATASVAASDAVDNAAPVPAPADDRLPVSRPDVYPNRTVGQILVKVRNGGIWQGSGSLVSDYTVLTAGHMVKNAGNQWLDIEWLRFIPARNHANEPYGRFDWVHMRGVHSGSRDWALISLSRPAGFQTGYLGVYAQLPISRWNGVGGLSHIGFPGDHADEMWVDQDGRVTGIDEERQLRTDIDAAHGQSGGPLVRGWFGGNPQVVASLVEGPNPVEDPNDFMPGWETSRDDTWMQWLCSDFGNRHPDDRFGGCSALAADDGEAATETTGALPNYDLGTEFADDSGPVVRRFSPAGRSMLMTPRRAAERDHGRNGG
jgi:V8-like Glu-specific endopeptidase